MYNILVLLTLATTLTGQTHLNKGSEERCYGELGCLVLDQEWWHPWLRPINLWPQQPDHINTTFNLHTRLRQEPKLVQLEPRDQLSLALSPLDAMKPTKVVIHGYNEDIHTPWITELTEALLKYGDYNVIVVDWSTGAQPPLLQAVANARLVGLQVAYLLHTLSHTINLQPQQVHLIGYSLGAHVAGYSGERVADTGRITGLAPSALYFEGMSPVVRLDESDAAFVDVVHTATDGPGFSERCGTVDFYPNGGGKQPGCGTKMDDNSDIERRDTAKSLFRQSCNMMMSLQLFITSLTCPHCFLGHECTDEYLYAYGMCYVCGEPNVHCVYLGILADDFLSQHRDRVPFFLSTAAAAPYRVYVYRVWLNLAHPEEAEDWLEGELTLTMKGANNITITTILPGSPVRLSHGQPRGWVLGLEEDLRAVEMLIVKWTHQASIFNNCGHKDCNTNLYIQTIKVTPIDYLPQSEQVRETRLLCGGLYNTAVPSGGQAILVPQDSCQEWSV